MAELKDIAKNKGFTMKVLAEESNIKYTTLLSMAQRPIDHWPLDNVTALEKTLNFKSGTLKYLKNSILLTPFVKWVGGKRQLLPELKKRLPQKYNHYFEPFIGGGALLLNEKAMNATINDFNPELTNAWLMVKNNVKELSNLLREHERLDSEEYYLNIRSADRDGRIVNMTSVERAARFIYMNKAGYNGLWRVNLKGQNNVPYGAHTHLNLVNENLFNVSEYLNQSNINIETGDYQNSLDNVCTGDFVYFDPPYIPVNATSAFTSYTPNGFGLVQQEQLRDFAFKLSQKGVFVMLSNSDVPLINELYSKEYGFKIHKVQATRMLNSNGSKRGKIGEVIITTY